MAFTTMHFAIGMGCAGTAASIGCLLLRRGWRWVPMAMTAGGIWACVPDMPRIFKEDFPSLPFAQTLSARPLQQWLNTHGDWFFFHRMLDDQPKEYALHGLFGILLLYTVSSFLLAVTHRRKPASSESAGDQESAQAVETSESPQQRAA